MYFFELQVLHLTDKVIIQILPRSQGGCVDRINSMCGWHTGDTEGVLPLVFLH